MGRVLRLREEQALMGRNWRPKKKCRCPKCDWTGLRAALGKKCPKCGFWCPTEVPKETTVDRDIEAGMLLEGDSIFGLATRPKKKSAIIGHNDEDSFNPGAPIYRKEPIPDGCEKCAGCPDCLTNKAP